MPHIRDRFTLPPVGTIYWSPVAERAWKVVKRAENSLATPSNNRRSICPAHL